MNIKNEVLRETESVCPVCLRRIPAVITACGEHIYLEKSCPGHGDFRTRIWEGKESFLRWSKKSPVVGVPEWDNLAVSGCPYDCGICPEHEQDACCVLLEVTNRCNQQCRYCFARAGDNGFKDKSFAEIQAILRFLLAHSMERPYNLQLSGGEPTLREDLPEIIAEAKEMRFPYIQLNTNGLRLARENGYAERLKNSGLNAVFLQFDGTEERIYEEIRGKRLFEIKTAAIDHCRKAGLGVVLVMTLVPQVNTGNIGKTIDFMLERLPHIRGLHFQPVSFFGRYPGGVDLPIHITISDLIAEINKQTGGRISGQDFVHLASGHPLCSFHGNFLWKETEQGKEIVAVSAPQSGCCCQPDIVKARDYIKKKWGSYDRENADQVYETASWDGFLQKYEQTGFSISAMAFQDAWTLDLERLKRCRVYVADSPGRLIPFCAYNLTSCRGEALYRK